MSPANPDTVKSRKKMLRGTRLMECLGSARGRGIILITMTALPKIAKRAVLPLALAAVCACQSVQTTEGGAVGIDRKQTMSPLVSSAQMDKSAADAYSKVLSDARAKG